MQYTLKELFDNLTITLTELKRRSGISDVTLISIRNGHSARRSTINTLLRTFSEIYGIKLTLKNVEGIIIQGKPINSTAVSEQAPIPSVPSSMGKESPTISSPQKRSRARFETEPLPEGSMLAKHFAINHGVSDGTFYDHMMIGRGPGTVPGEQRDPTMGVKDHVEHSERDKPGRPKEKERYLTADQQREALAFWQRHNVSFEQCNDFACWCHTFEK